MRFKVGDVVRRSSQYYSKLSLLSLGYNKWFFNRKMTGTITYIFPNNVIRVKWKDGETFRHEQNSLKLYKRGDDV